LRKIEVSIEDSRRVMVIGSGTRFISGISHYTHALACALSADSRTSVVLMRSLVPRRLYPGAQRVGARIAEHVYPTDVRVYDGVDWFWFPSLLRALKLVWSERPNVVALQWWTGAVAHTYLALVALARLRGARVVLEMHEVQDTGEARVPFVAVYTRVMLQLLAPLVDAFVVHSESDQEELEKAMPTAGKPIEVIHHGPYAQYAVAPQDATRTAPGDVVNLMYFGTIRPYKGLEDLVRAFDALPDPTAFWLTVVGETWEGWTLPAELIAASRHADRITFVNRYVTEHEAACWLAGADALVLPYHRSSASGPLHVGMALGLRVVITDIPALVDAATGYEGCVFVPVRDVGRLRDALSTVAERRGVRYRDPSSWEESVRRYEKLFTRLGVPSSSAGEGLSCARA
jgi:glycosyltransferase involved in cell wall biosynthesis